MVVILHDPKSCTGFCSWHDQNSWKINFLHLYHLLHDHVLNDMDMIKSSHGRFWKKKCHGTSNQRGMRECSLIFFVVTLSKNLVPTDVKRVLCLLLGGGVHALTIQPHFKGKSLRSANHNAWNLNSLAWVKWWGNVEQIEREDYKECGFLDTVKV